MFYRSQKTLAEIHQSRMDWKQRCYNSAQSSGVIWNLTACYLKPSRLLQVYAARYGPRMREARRIHWMTAKVDRCADSRLCQHNAADAALSWWADSEDECRSALHDVALLSDMNAVLTFTIVRRASLLSIQTNVRRSAREQGDYRFDEDD